MAWIEVHQSLISHRKTIALADVLDMPEVYAVGHLVAFWLWALDNVQDGVLDGITPSMIERAAQWNGERGKLVDSFREVGFLDEVEGQLSIHDWMDYAGRLIAKKKANAERMREARATDVQSTKETRAMHVQNTCDARAGATNQPTNQPKKDIDHAVGYSNEFETFWSVYPRHVDKKKAFKAWNVLVKRGTDVQSIITAAQNYASYCKSNKTEQQFIKHPATFLGPNTPYEEFVHVMHESAVAIESDRPGPYIQPGLPKAVLELEAAIKRGEFN